MKTLTSLLLLLPMFGILMVQSVRGQTEEEFRQEFQQYAETHSQAEWQAYALSRFAAMTNNVILEEAAWSALERSFSSGPCLSVRQQICDEKFLADLATATALSTAAMFACTLTANPITFAVCAAAVAFQHALRIEAAKRNHRACYLAARLECLPAPTPTPTPGGGNCAILGPERGTEEEASTKDIVPLLADCSLYEDPCLCPPRSPVIIDVAGNGFDLTNVAEGVMFNITGFGREPIGWTRSSSDDAFLALDLNANGLIENGAELFGNFSIQPEPAAGAERNGFAALSVFDYNADGKIDSNDSVYSELRLWQDRNHNGVSEPDELHPLDKLGLKTLFLNYNRSELVDKFGNEFRYRAGVEDFGDGQLGRWAWDVFLVSARRRGLAW